MLHSQESQLRLSKSDAHKRSQQIWILNTISEWRAHSCLKSSSRSGRGQSFRCTCRNLSHVKSLCGISSLCTPYKSLLCCKDRPSFENRASPKPHDYENYAPRASASRRRARAAQRIAYPRRRQADLLQTLLERLLVRAGGVQSVERLYRHAARRCHTEIDAQPAARTLIGVAATADAAIVAL